MRSSRSVRPCRTRSAVARATPGTPHHPVPAGAGDDRAGDRLAVAEQRADDRQVVGRVVDGGGPRAPYAESRGRRVQRGDACAHPLVVGVVELAGPARLLVGVAHAPEQAALLARPPVDARRHVEDHRQGARVDAGHRCGDDHLVPRPSRPHPSTRGGADRGQVRPAGEHDGVGVDGTVAGVHPHGPAALDAQPGERPVLAHLDAERDESGGVGQHVAGSIDVAVAGGVRRPARGARCEAGRAAVDLVAVPPLHVEPERALERDPVVRGRDLVVGEARHQVALGDEPGVEGVAVALGGVELPAEQPEPDRRLGAALRPHHAGGPAAGAAAEGVGLDQDDRAALLGEQARRPRADGATAHHDDVGPFHGTEPGPD